MGINGLLKGLNPILVPAPGSNTGGGGGGGIGRESNQFHIRQFEGTTLAIDASSWLHKAGYGCAMELVESIESGSGSSSGLSGTGGGGIPSPKAQHACTRYVLSRCSALLDHAKVTRLLLVFDGKRCPLKAGTNREREAKRRANLTEARRLRSEGRTSEAAEKYKLCVRVTDEMARIVARAVDAEYKSTTCSTATAAAGKPRVSCIFAPYEADAQLAKVCIDGVADAVVTEDSDLLVYSATCGVPFPIIYKLDRDTGSCDVVTMDWLLSPSPYDPSPRSAADASGDGREG